MPSRLRGRHHAGLERAERACLQAAVLHACHGCIERRLQLRSTAGVVSGAGESAGSDAGIDVVSSEYATIAAENTALENLTKQVADRIITRVSLTLRNGAK